MESEREMDWVTCSEAGRRGSYGSGWEVSWPSMLVNLQISRIHLVVRGRVSGVSTGRQERDELGLYEELVSGDDTLRYRR